MAFLYRWTQKSTGMWYEGSRTKQGCHPEDGYICSSKTVEPMIIENKNDWVREILVIGESKYIRSLEAKRLSLLDAKNDPMSYNKDNATGKFNTVGISPVNKGMPSALKGTKRLVAHPNKGKKLGPYTDGRGDKISKSLKGNVPWNKGQTKDNNSKMAAFSEYKKKNPSNNKGIIKPKVVCRLMDQKELDIQNFTIWLNKQGVA